MKQLKKWWHATGVTNLALIVIAVLLWIFTSQGLFDRIAYVLLGGFLWSNGKWILGLTQADEEINKKIDDVKELIKGITPPDGDPPPGQDPEGEK